MSDEPQGGGVQERAAERLCWWCQHFYYRQAEPDWSEYTAGNAFEIHCRKGNWEFDSFTSTRADFAHCVTFARQCPDFVAVEVLI